MNLLSANRRARATVTVAAAALLATSLGVTNASRAEAYTFTSCRWPSASISYDNQASGASGSAFANGASSWSSRTDVSIYSRPGSSNFFFIRNNLGDNNYDGYTSWDCGSSGTFRSTAYNLGDNNYDGYTSWDCGSSGTFRSTASINGYYTDSFPTRRRQAVAAHEIGHGIGLNHSGSNALMYTSAANFYDRTGQYYPVADDINGINARY